MSSETTNLVAFLSVFVLAGLFGVFYTPEIASSAKSITMFESVKRIADERTTNGDLTIGIGWNANLDLIVKATAFFEKASLAPASSGVNHQMLDSPSDLMEAFSYFFERSSAAERFVSSDDVFDSIVDSAFKVDDHRISTGGNAALMGNRLVAEGATVMLGGQVGPKLQQLLHPDMKVVPSATGGEVVDSVHLILEYPKGASWGSAVSSRANRFIVVRDLPNAELTSLEATSDAMADFDPSVFVASGLNQLEGLPPKRRTQRLAAAISALRRLKRETLIHLELASIADQSFVEELALAALPEVDSLGLNEQELASLYESMGGLYSDSDTSSGYGDSARDKETVAAMKAPFTQQALLRKVPDPAAVAHALRLVFSRLPEVGPHSLSRIHFHSLAFHIIAERVPLASTKWQSAPEAVARGSKTATVQACNFTQADLSALKAEWLQLIAPTHFTVLNSNPSVVRPFAAAAAAPADTASASVNGSGSSSGSVSATILAGGEEEVEVELTAQQPVVSWERHCSAVLQRPLGAAAKRCSVRYTLAPVLVCANPKHTVGLGDAISAAALAASAPAVAA